MKHGFSQAIVPFANRPQKSLSNMDTHGVKTLGEALEVIADLGNASK